MGNSHKRKANDDQQEEQKQGQEQSADAASSAPSAKSARIDSASSAPDATAADSSAMEDEPQSEGAASAAAHSSASSSSSSAAAASSTPSSASSSSSILPPLSSVALGHFALPTDPFELECAAAAKRRRERLEGPRSASELVAMLPLVFDHLELVGFSFMPTVLQSIIAEYAVPDESRSFVGATRDAVQPTGWTLEQMDEHELKRRILQRWIQSLQNLNFPQMQDRMTALNSLSLDQLIDESSEIGPPDGSSLHGGPPTALVYPLIPFEYLIELGGVDRVFSHETTLQVNRHAQQWKQRQKQIAKEAPMARGRDLLLFLQLLFQQSNKFLDLPRLDDPLVKLIAEYAAPSLSFPAEPWLFAFGPNGWCKRHLIQTSLEFCREVVHSCCDHLGISHLIDWKAHSVDFARLLRKTLERIQLARTPTQTIHPVTLIYGGGYDQWMQWEQPDG